MSWLRSLVQQARTRLVDAEDTVCLQRAELVTEAYQKFADDPPPIKRAKAFAHVLANMDLDLDANPVFAGNTSSKPRAWMLVPEFGFDQPDQILIEHPHLRGLLDDAVPKWLRDFWADKSFGGSAGIGHLAVNLHTVVHTGLAALAERADRLAHGDTDAAIYQRAMSIALRAVIDWAARYARHARDLASRIHDPLRRRCLMRIADACSRVPALPARNLFEGLQAIVLVHLAIAIEGHGMSVSIGLPDRVLSPFIQQPFDSDEATDLLAAFLLKISANSLYGRGSKTQAITVGGADATGADQCNDLTACFLEAANLARVGDPPLFLRWHPAIDPAIEKRAAELLAAGLSMPLLVNDLPTAQGFMHMGVKPEHAWSYCVIGCNELGIPGLCAHSAAAWGGVVHYVSLLNEVLLSADVPPPSTMSELFARLRRRMATHLRASRLAGRQHMLRMAHQVPTPFTSALMDGLIDRGQDLLVGMIYQPVGIYERGLSNAANALAAIDQLVFTTGALTMDELVEAVRADFPDERLRHMLLRAPKWGNGDPRADRWARRLVELRYDILEAIDRDLGQTHCVCHVVRSLHHVDARHLPASPDGRRAWTPVADSIGAVTGTAQAGPTGILNSVLKLDAATYYRGGYNLNLTLPAHTPPEVVRWLFRAFFRHGGQELQIACIDPKVLRDAQQNPHDHQDLIVRFAGLSARFVDLSREEQDEIIQRAEAAAGQTATIELACRRPS